MSILLLLLAALVAGYFLILRPILRRREDLQVFYSESDKWWAYVADILRGMKTRLMARIVILAPVLIAAHDFVLPFLNVVDVTPISAKIPPTAWLLITTGVGALFNWLRNITPSANDGGPSV